MKKIISVVLICSFLFSFLGVNAFATNKNTLTTANFEEALSEYFEMREATFTNNSRTIDYTNVVVSKNVKEDNDNRKEQIVSKMQNIDKIFAIEVQTTPYVLEQSVKSNGNIEATVYEWTWIEYNSTGTGYATDELGYATIHEMLFVPTSNGYKIERDTYFEGNTTGAISSDYEPEIVEEEEIIFDISFAEGNANVSRSYSPSAAANYADRWVTDINASNYDELYSVPRKYNTAVYGYIPRNDCANYVSQCLYAGGLEETDDWYFERPIGENESTENCCPITWISTGNLAGYLLAQGYGSVVATNNNVKMGNPVYVSGHIVICVGESSDGTPIINGHTNDMYHCPWTWVSSDGEGTNARTIRIT